MSVTPNTSANVTAYCVATSSEGYSMACTLYGTVNTGATLDTIRIVGTPQSISHGSDTEMDDALFELSVQVDGYINVVFTNALDVVSKIFVEINVREVVLDRLGGDVE